jgi:hypothetical protein
MAQTRTPYTPEFRCQMVERHQHTDHDGFEALQRLTEIAPQFGPIPLFS